MSKMITVYFGDDETADEFLSFIEGRYVCFVHPMTYAQLTKKIDSEKVESTI